MSSKMTPTMTPASSVDDSLEPIASPIFRVPESVTVLADVELERLTVLVGAELKTSTSTKEESETAAWMKIKLSVCTGFRLYISRLQQTHNDFQGYL